jgi:hypothetical protein
MVDHFRDRNLELSRGLNATLPSRASASTARRARASVASSSPHSADSTSVVDSGAKSIIGHRNVVIAVLSDEGLLIGARLTAQRWKNEELHHRHGLIWRGGMALAIRYPKKEVN